MELIREPHEAALWTALNRRKGLSIGFVPTMGALHEGHLELIHKARKECDRVCCSIFVNPLQFNDPEDLAKYPIRTAEDKALLESAGCQALFIPLKEELFKGFTPSQYDLGGIDSHWEGPSRPGHFQGVANVVERLFHYVRPDRAYFGAKDRQQLTILQHLQAKQRWPVTIVECPTVREPDGLAMSSRNLRLAKHEREAAPILFRALGKMASLAFTTSVEGCIEAGQGILAQETLLDLDYLGIADAGNLEPISEWGDRRQAVVLVAAHFGEVRLIDNLTLKRA